MSNSREQLSAAGLLADAKARTGLGNFGQPLFTEGLHRLVDSINREANLSAIGFEAQRQRITGLLTNRLLLEQAWQQHPEIADEEINSPIIIVGLPRTGSTMTHRLLASDPAHTAMLWWEGRYPAVLPGETRGQPDQRRALGRAEVEAVLAASGDALDIHPWDFDAPDEEILLLEHTFLSTTPEAFMYLPGYSAWIEAQDHRPVYADLKRMLQSLQWQEPGRRGKRWILKSPHHLGFVDALLTTFPDAWIVQTHRHPAETVPSLCSMCASLAQPLTQEPNHADIGSHWVHKLSRAVQHCMRVSEQNPERFLHLYFTEVVADPLAQMARVYGFVNSSFDGRAEQAMQAFRDDDAHRPGSHTWRLEDYGLDAGIITSLFREYISRHQPGEADAVKR